jgi:hypothetical protein
MEKIIAALTELEQINQKYERSNDDIAKLQEEMADAKVCTPVIGKFSSGKSALVNTVLGYSRKILKEDITPETAIPAEIVYTNADEQAEIMKNDGTYERLSIEEYRNYAVDATTAKHVRIQLRNDFLSEIPDVMLVDMPGFESGFEIHNKAIDNYLPQSLAYIVTFPADDLIVRSSVGDILKELRLSDMELCVVITKYDKSNDDFEVTFEKMKESLKRYVGNRQIRYCRTSSFTGDAREFEDFLKEIQEKSKDILARKYKKMAMSEAGNIEVYLKTVLNGSQLSESQLDEQEEKLQRQLSALDSKFTKEKNDFAIEISDCIEEIKSDVQSAMEAEEPTLVTMALNNQSINERLNSVIRNTVTVSVKKHFIPKVEKYLKRVDKTISGEMIGDVHISFAYDAEQMNKDMTGNIVAVAAAALLSEILAPPLGIIAGIIIKFAGKKLAEDKKRENAKQEIRQKLRREVFPQVLNEVGNGIEKAVMKETEHVNISIEEEMNRQRENLEGAMSDLRQKIQEEKDEKQNQMLQIQADLERIEEIKDGLR